MSYSYSTISQITKKKRNNQVPSWITLNDEEVFHRKEFACGVYNDRYIIVAGGNTPSQTLDVPYVENLNTVIMYDTYTNEYWNLPNLPFAGECEGTVLKDHFYVSDFYRDSVYQICLSSESSTSTSTSTMPSSSLEWEKVPLNLSRIDNIVSNDEHLYIIDTKQGFMRGVYRYDPNTEKLTNMPDVPTSRYDFATAVLGHNIFLMGGLEYPHVFSNVDVFNTHTQRWSRAPFLPIPLCHATATVFQKRWILVTGESSIDAHAHACSNTNTQTTFLYDTVHQQFISPPSLSLFTTITPRVHQKIVMIRSHLISLGGLKLKLNEDKICCPIESINLKRLIPDWKWDSIKHYVLLRKLVEEGRAGAHPVLRKQQTSDEEFNDNNNCNNCNRYNHSMDTQNNINTDEVIQKLCTEVISDVFRNVLSFLV